MVGVVILKEHRPSNSARDTITRPFGLGWIAFLCSSGDTEAFEASKIALDLSGG
jgi:hypothetical protein